MTAKETTADTAFEQLAERYVDEVTEFSPVWATWLGDHRYDDRLDEVTVEAKQRKAEFARTFLDALDSIDAGRLSRANQVDAAMLTHSLRAQLWHHEVLREWTWNPMGYTGLAGNAAYSLMARDFAPLPERLRNVTSRLEQFPRLLTQAREILDPPRVPKVHAETAVKQNPGILTIIDGMIAPHLEALPPADRPRLTEAMDTARSAVQAHQQWLENDLVPQAAGDFRIGQELYDKKLAFTLQSPLTRQEIRRQAESEMTRTTDEMYEIAAKLHRQEHPSEKPPPRPSLKYKQQIIQAALEMAYRDTLDAEDIVAGAKRSLAKAAEFVRKKALVTMPDDPVDIIVMPEFRRGTSMAYCDSPGPLDVGQQTYYAIAPPPADWTAEQLRSYLREYNVRSLHNLTVHEAMPGHFLQLVHSNRYPSTLRAMLGSGVFIEGWAVYAEQMMIDQGFLEGDPLMRLVSLKWDLRSIANAIIDQAVHTEGMTKDQAISLMMDDTFQEEREAADKWTRVQLTSTQLSTYFVGTLEHAALRRDIEVAWDEQFDLRKYHDTVLSFGSPPTQYVRALMLDLPISPAQPPG